MPQLYCQLASRPSPWLLGRTSAGLCTLQTACPLTITYSGGSADTIAAATGATVYGGSATVFDAGADVWVVLTVAGSGALQVVKEADLATVTGDWAGLARIAQHSTEPYQPQAYLGAGGVGTVPPTSWALASDTTTVRKSLWTGSTNNDPDVTYAGWTTLAFTETGWAAAVVAALGTGQSALVPSGATALWDSATPTVSATPGEGVLFRQRFVLPAGTITSATLQCAFDAYGSAYLNGTLIGGETDLSSGPLLTLSVPAGTLLAGAANVIALKGYDDGGGGGNKAWATWRLDVQYVASGGVPDPGGTEGAMLYYHGGAWVDLGVGASGKVLTSDGTDPGWATPATSGTVTSVQVAVPAPLSSAGGPITASGTITLSWASGQTANRVLASPDGTTGAVSLRALVAGDIPSLPASQITSGQLAAARGGTGLDTSAVTDGQLLIGQSSDHTFGLATLTAGSGVTLTNAGHGITIAASGGSGTVTSVTLSVPSIFSVSPATITTSGTFAVTLANENAATVFAGPASGSAAAPTFRALQGSDLPAAAAAGGHIHAHGHFL